MSIDDSQRLNAFAALNRYFALIELSEPTVEQAQEAAEALCQFYGAENEEELLSKADEELRTIYLEIKNEIMKTAKLAEGDPSEQEPKGN